MTNWPWPLDSIQNWFEDIFKSVAKWIADSITWIWDGIVASFNSAYSFITSSLTGLWNNITAGFAAVGSWISNAASSIVSGISSFVSTLISGVMSGLSALGNVIGNIVGSIWTTISQGLASLVNTISTVLGSLYSGVQQIFSGFLNSVAALFSDLWNKVNSSVSGAVTWITNALTLAVGTIAGYVVDALAGVAKAIGEGFKAMLEWLWGSLQWIATQILGAVNAVRSAVEGGFQTLVSGVVGTVTEAFSPSTLPEEVQKASDDLAKNVQDTIARILPVKPSSLPSFEEVQGSALRNMAINIGASIIGNVAGIAIDLVHPIKPLGVQVAITNIIRNITENVATAPMFTIPLEAGVWRPMRYYYNERNPSMVPGSGDLIRFVVREVIDLAAFNQNMLYQGFDSFWAAAYWESHFELPGLNTLVDAFHRGAIDESELGKYVFWHDFKTEPRPGIEKSDIEIIRATQKTLIPRTDIRFAWEAGIKSDEELIAWYRMLGYEEDSEDMAAIQKARALSAEINRVRDDWVNDYIDGFINEDTLRANLTEIGVGPTVVEYYITSALKRRERAYKRALLTLYQDGYEKDLVTDDDLAARAGEILVDEDAKSLFLEKAYVSKYKKPKAS